MTDLILDTGATGADPMALLDGMSSGASPAAAPTVERWLISRLRPNAFNGQVFSDSLGSESISQLADSMRAHGQLSPIVVTPDGIIVDGERRWRAATQLGLSYVAVVVAPHTEDSIRAIVLDACTGTRHLSLREQTSVYRALLDHLRDLHGRPQGRPQGRPEKTISEENGFWEPERVRAEAAKRAGFSSVMQATRAEAVFSRGDPDLQDQVNREGISLTAAYAQIEKRPRTPAAITQSEDPGPAARGATTDAPTVPQESEPPGGLPPHTERSPGSSDDASKPPPAAVDRVTEAPASSPSGQGNHHGTSVPPIALPVSTPSDTAPSEPAPVQVAAELDDGEEWTVEDHVAALTQHLQKLSEDGWDDAMAQARTWIMEFKTAIGPKPVEGESAEDRHFRMLGLRV